VKLSVEDVPGLLDTALGDCGLNSRPGLAEAVVIYARELEKWQRTTNLASPNSLEELVRFHFVEAFWAVTRFLPEAARVADIGSGAGFPGLAMKLYEPRAAIALLERNHKKCAFVKQVARLWKVRVEVYAGAAEAWPGWRGVELATVRALRLEAPVLQVLSKAGVRVLQFRGERSEQLPDGWSVVREEPYPLARSRWATLYAPPDVPRET